MSHLSYKLVLGSTKSRFSYVPESFSSSVMAKNLNPVHNDSPNPRDWARNKYSVFLNQKSKSVLWKVTKCQNWGYPCHDISHNHDSFHRIFFWYTWKNCYKHYIQYCKTYRQEEVVMMYVTFKRCNQSSIPQCGKSKQCLCVIFIIIFSL